MVGFTYDPEKFQLNIARYKIAGDRYEVVVDPDAALAFKEGKISDINTVLKAKHIFFDAQKGLLATASNFPNVFSTDDQVKIATTILQKGELHLTSEYKNGLREQKKKQILHIIKINAVDITTGHPIPATRIETAFAQSKAKIDEFKPAELQVQDILHKIHEIIPIRFEQKELRIHIQNNHVSKVKNILKTFGQVPSTEFDTQGNMSATIIIPGGLEEEFLTKMATLTAGTMTTQIVRKI